jgi:hypothetical protein
MRDGIYTNAPTGPLDQTLFLITAFLSILVTLFQPYTAQAAVSLSITPITWNVVGLDFNNVSVGPNNFPVGARVCNTGTTPATNLVASFRFSSGWREFSLLFSLSRDSTHKLANCTAFWRHDDHGVAGTFFQ